MVVDQGDGLLHSCRRQQGPTWPVLLELNQIRAQAAQGASALLARRWGACGNKCHRARRAAHGAAVGEHGGSTRAATLLRYGGYAR